MYDCEMHERGVALYHTSHWGPITLQLWHFVPVSGLSVMERAGTFRHGRFLSPLQSFPNP